MDPNSYTNSDVNPARLGVPFDAEGEYEPHDTIYTLTVLVPEKLPSKLRKWLHNQKSSHIDQPNCSFNSEYDHLLSKNNNNLKSECQSTSSQPPPKPKDILDLTDIIDMRMKIVKLKAYQFPYDFRCRHVEQEGRECHKGCYILEKGEWTSGCKANDCEGHRWGGKMKRDERGRWCFGKKGERMVCIDVY